MLRGQSRELVKRLLALGRAKLVFNRITKTRYTRFYFFLSAFTCLILCALQVVILSDNTKAVEILTAVVDEAECPAHITVLKDGELYVCDSIPDRQGSNCIVLWMSGGGSTNVGSSLVKRSRTRRASQRRVRRQASVGEPPSEDSDDDGGVSDDDSDDDNEVDDGVLGSPSQRPPPPSPTPIPPPTSIVGATSASPTSTISVSTASGSTSITISSNTGTGTSVTFTTATSQTPSASTSRTPTPTKTASTSTEVPNSDGISLSQNSNTPYSMSCIYSMSWLEETLHDSQREDVATVFFQLWLFGLGVVAILNESLPHLGAAFAGHILAVAWSSTRISGTKSLARMYRDAIVAGPCGGADMLGTWFELRQAHTVPVVVLNIISLIGFGFLSYKLLRGYSAASFDRIGSLPSLQRVYKLVLVFSVGLQLSGFFVAVSSGLWLSKVAHGSFRALSHHAGLYIASFAIILAAEIPWLIMGWFCVRRECKARFWMFAVLSAGLLAISGVMFGSDAYRTIFKLWGFFATVTVTSFILLVFTVALGILCYLNYGKGLREYLQMSDKPEGADFDPVGLLDHSEKQPDQSLPQASFHAPVSHEQGDSEWLTAQALPQPPSAAQGSQSIFRTLPEPPQTTSSNPFDSDKDSLYDFHLPKSVWSANTSDIDTRSFRTFTSSESTATATHTFLLQPPPRSVIPQPHPRIPSFNGTVASLVPFEGMPVLPLTPMSFRRSGSSKSITPYPVGSVRSSHGARSNSRSSVSSSSSISSLGSTQRSPFALTPVTLSHTDTSTRRDSGYPTSSDRSSFYAQSEGGLYVVNGSVRQSVGSSVSGEYQVAGPPGRRGTFGV
ncbi:hypothetical protein FA13DRAFT_1682795 [Coprinellus micaceus]|uniref:Uncharacterized protein n=1 Tax=Coprinellus micaceus TaxID=71717 RepID=A0A4Y7TR40_COPMI|nr:hypothetical protein FA13DRAFT_1682795 [Coprinellus micaceus]